MKSLKEALDAKKESGAPTGAVKKTKKFSSLRTPTPLKRVRFLLWEPSHG